MKNTILSLLLLLSSIGITQEVSPEVLEAFDAESHTFEDKQLPYRILYPDNFDSTKSYPLHVFLHGSGERGDDNELQLIHGGELFIEKNKKYPAIVIFPQCPKDDYWADVNVTREGPENVFSFPEKPKKTWAMRALISLVDTILDKDYINKNRVYLGGLSMGGMGTFELLYHKPQTFAAATPICGGGYPSGTSRWATNTPAWVFHGEGDAVVPVRYSQLMVEALLREGASPRLSIYPNVNHDSWTNAFAEPDFFSWIYSQYKNDKNEEGTETVAEDCTPEWLKFSENTLLKKFEVENNVLKSMNNANRIIFMGDSITEGWETSSPEFWKQHPNYINRGVGGQTTPQMLVRFRKDVLDLKPEKVVILAGTNDIAGNTGFTSLETIFENIKTMSELATYHNIEVVLCSVLPVFDYPWKPGLQPANKIIELNNKIESYAQENNFTYVDYHSVMKNRDNGMQALLSYDGVHCTQAGYEIMENILEKSLEE